MQGSTYADLPLQALLMAVWRRRPKTKVRVHSDQGSQFTGYEWQEFLEQRNLIPSMSRRGNGLTLCGRMVASESIATYESQICSFVNQRFVSGRCSTPYHAAIWYVRTKQDRRAEPMGD